MGKNLIDKNEILSFPHEDYSGFSNFAYDMINKNNLDDRFDEAYQLCEDILDGLMNAVETAEVIEKREITTCICSTQTEDTYDRIYEVYYYTCGHCFESVKTENDEEDFKFCPYCGAEYEKIVRH